jgi:hypothetical protein
VGNYPVPKGKYPEAAAAVHFPVEKSYFQPEKDRFCPEKDHF